MTSDNRSIISGGPSKYDLMVSLFESQPLDSELPRRSIIFKVDSGKRIKSGPRNTDRIIYNEVEVRITLIAQEDGSGESWLFEGSMVGIRMGRIHGYYSTATRKGWYARGARYTVFGISNKKS